jgi:hypothetical protein
MQPSSDEKLEGQDEDEEFEELIFRTIAFAVVKGYANSLKRQLPAEALFDPDVGACPDNEAYEADQEDGHAEDDDEDCRGGLFDFEDIERAEAGKKAVTLAEELAAFHSCQLSAHLSDHAGKCVDRGPSAVSPQTGGTLLPPAKPKEANVKSEEKATAKVKQNPKARAPPAKAKAEPTAKQQAAPPAQAKPQARPGAVAPGSLLVTSDSDSDGPPSLGSDSSDTPPFTTKSKKSEVKTAPGLSGLESSSESESSSDSGCDAGTGEGAFENHAARELKKFLMRGDGFRRRRDKSVMKNMTTLEKSKLVLGFVKHMSKKYFPEALDFTGFAKQWFWKTAGTRRIGIYVGHVREEVSQDECRMELRCWKVLRKKAELARVRRGRLSCREKKHVRAYDEFMRSKYGIGGADLEQGKLMQKQLQLLQSRPASSA